VNGTYRNKLYRRNPRFLPVLAAILAIAFVFTLVSAAIAADAKFPRRPINFYIPFPPGGFFDVTYRPMAEAAGKILGQPMVPINKTGASGTLAPTMLKTMEPDGYNIGIATTALFYLPSQQDVSFDPMKDFTYICRTIDSLMGVVVRADSPWKTFKEFLAYAKANPGKIKYATASPRGTLRLAMSDIAIKEGIKWEVVPFMGGQEVVTALLGKHVDAISQGIEWIPHVEAGELRLLAVFGEQRSKRFPNVPCLKELGYGGYPSPHGIIGPPGMPKDVVNKLAEAFKTAMNDPKVQKVLAEFGSPVIYQGSADYTAWSKTSLAYHIELVKRAGLEKK